MSEFSGAESLFPAVPSADATRAVDRSEIGQREHASAAAIPGSELPGPYGVGEYAAALRRRLRSFARVQLVGELVNLRAARARVYFELRDAQGAISCAAWRDDWEAIVARAGAAPQEGMQLVVAGGCDYYPGSATAS
ncbi:MAG TPA: exodeoxyribonuclease VII large subunit, partial [Solirubrobacteraceae bacterium]|nr:exodeoxyribonuclease VII large subunit [Solirubrobacteraceae bacterium]